MFDRISDLRTLGLGADANADDIKKAYRRLAKEFHPDHAGQDSKGAFQAVSAAYERVCANDYQRKRKSAAGPAAEAFCRDLVDKSFATVAHHGKVLLDEQVAGRGRIGRAVATFGRAVLDEAGDALGELLNGGPRT